MARILLVEDDPDVRELVGYKLAGAGHEVVSAADGAVGLQLIRERSPDLVVLDVMLPGLSGLEVCRLMPLGSGGARTPVLMLSARVQEHDVLAAFDAGADDYVTKPFSARELLSRAEALLARSR